MLLDQKEFEHKIEERKLKKGLKLFLQNKVELLNKIAQSDFNFLVKGEAVAEIFIKKKGEKILNYTCSCGAKNYCEHFAAVLFYLQEEFLEFSKKQILKQKKERNASTKKSEFENYFNQMKTVTKSFLSIGKLNSKDERELVKKLNSEHTKASAFNNDLYFDLALILHVSQLINSNTATNNALVLELKNSTTNLEKAYKQGLSAKEKNAWQIAAHYSLRSQSYFRTGVFYFLISKAILFLKEKGELQQLLTLLKKRKENKNSLSSISKKLIIEIELSILLATISGKTYTYKKVEERLELPMALAELEFVKKRPLKSFKILEQYAYKLKVKSKDLYLDLIEYILVKAKELQNYETEERYLKEKFIYAYYIDQKELHYYFEMIGPEASGNVATELVIIIRSNAGLFAFDKIADILFYQNRLDELIQEIKREKNKFTVLHKIAVKKFPEYNETFLQLYIKHLSQAITDAKFPYFQERVFNNAREFLDKLPDESIKFAINDLKKKTMYDKYMQGYIKKSYPDIIDL